MVRIASFIFSPFSENTYVLYDDTRDCVIIDPGCYNDTERAELADFIAREELKPVKLLNTHCHIDHVFGNRFVADKWGLGLEMNKNDLDTLHALVSVGHLYELNVEPSPEPVAFLDEGDKVKFGETILEILFTPGHSKGSICFYHREQKFVIGGDVLFHGSIGRSDLPGGDHETLLSSIRNKLFRLPDDFTVFSGHGPETTIGYEKRSNPFVGEE